MKSNKLFCRQIYHQLLMSFTLSIIPVVDFIQYAFGFQYLLEVIVKYLLQPLSLPSLVAEIVGHSNWSVLRQKD